MTEIKCVYALYTKEGVLLANILFRYYMYVLYILYIMIVMIYILCIYVFGDMKNKDIYIYIDI
jgi:hypothetical protein